MKSFLLIHVICSVFTADGLKLMNYFTNDDDTTQTNNSDNMDSTGIKDVIDQVIDGIMDETTSELTFIPSSAPSSSPTLRTASDPTAVPTKYPIDVTSSPVAELTDSSTFISTNAPTINPISSLTFEPTKGLTNSPTFEATTFPTLNPTNYPSNIPTTPIPTSSPTIVQYECSLEKKEYQLKMYWRIGMEWQDERKERAWCAECDDDCDKGEDVRIRECDDDEKEQSWIFYDCTVRPKRNQDVCFTAGTTRKDLTGKIELRDCDAENADVQRFRLFDPEDKREEFQVKLLKPGYDDICLSQEHHPRDKEELRFYSCRTAFENDPGVNDDTSHWEVGTFDGHR